MQKDFTIKILTNLLNELIKNNYRFCTFLDFLGCENNKTVVLRHDIDILTPGTIEIAEMENKLGIKGTYYFRSVKCSFNPDVIKKIALLGHEIGYHYEDLTLEKGNFENAIKSFENNLFEFRKYYPVKTICMHGSPLSKWDNKLLWDKYSYRNYGVLGEPYFDLNYDRIFYLTDTGRRWDGNVSVRDKVNSGFDMKFRKTEEIIEAVKENNFPNVALITIHPQRWNDDGFKWFMELVSQNAKNVIKKFILKKK